MTKEEIKEGFDEEYQNLLDIEESFRKQCNSYGVGEKTKVSEMDESYSEMKRVLKRIRKLAKESLKKNT